MDATRRELLIRLGAAILASPWAEACGARPNIQDAVVKQLVASWSRSLSPKSASLLGGAPAAIINGKS